MALRVERIQDSHTLETIKETWNSLLDKSEMKMVELTYEWQMTHWKYFNEGAELFVLIVCDDESIVAVAPLKATCRRILGIKIRCLEIIASAESNYQDLLIGENSSDVLECILDYLLRNQGAWDFLNLKHIPEYSNTAQFLLSHLRGYPLRKLTVIEKCMFLEIVTKGAYPEELINKGKARKNIRHRVRRVERELGNIHLRHCSANGQFRSDLLVLFDLHRKRWNHTETPSMFNDDRYREFYLEATQPLMSKGQIQLSTLEAGEIKLAQTLSFACDNKVVGQLLAYDPDYIKYSPEIVLLELYTNELIANGVKILDFGSYNPYKERWINRLKNRINFQIYSKRLLPSFIYAIMVVYQGSLGGLRKMPHLLNGAKSLRRSFRLLLQIHWNAAEKNVPSGQMNQDDL